MIRSLFILTLAQLLLLPGALAQEEGEPGNAAESAPRPQGPRYPCKEDEKHRAFDFWVGTWNVTMQGRQAGTNEIKLILGDCVLFENWTSARGSTGKSFNYYDRAEGHWRQIWIDDRGGVIEFTGEIRDGAMYYTATTKDPADGSETEHKLTFSQNDDGSVRQLWEQSNDGGATWQTVWDGHYASR